MTGNPEAPGGGRAPADTPSTAASEPAERPRSGPVTELALVAAGLGLVVYLLGFVDDAASGGSFVGALLLGGGLLAGSVALPTVRASVLVPAAVATVTGALFLLQSVVGGSDSAIDIGALVLALLEAAAATGAALLHAGVVHARPRRPKQAAAAPYGGGYPAQGYPSQGYPAQGGAVPGPQGGPAQGYPPQAGPAFPGQQYPGQPYPGSYPGHPGEPYPADQYAGEHAYAQHARYGAQYGVPGYPPPPPYGAPGHDPSAPGPAERAPDAPAGDAPTTVAATEAYRSGVPVTGTPGATGASGGAGTPASGATVIYGSGAYPPAAPRAEHRAEPRVETPATATGSHAAPEVVASGSHAAPEPAPAREDGEDDRTRTIPRVTDER